MLPTKIYSITIGASQSHRLLVQGEYFKLMSVTGPVTVQSDFGRLDSLTTGQGLEKTPFSYLLLTDTSGGSNTVQILVGDENFIDAVTGSVSIAGRNGTLTQSQRTVTNVNATLLVAKADRKYLLIQNNDATGIIYVTVDGTAATTAKGIRILPNESFEMDSFCSVGIIGAIGSIASNANVVTVEG